MTKKKSRAQKEAARRARQAERLTHLPADQRRAVLAALRAAQHIRPAATQTTVVGRIADIGDAVRRTDQRRRSDVVTDSARRLTIGVRLPRETVERYRAAAAARGMSLYRWAALALEQMYHSQSHKPD